MEQYETVPEDGDPDETEMMEPRMYGRALAPPAGGGYNRAGGSYNRAGGGFNPLRDNPLRDNPLRVGGGGGGQLRARSTVSANPRAAAIVAENGGDVWQDLPTEQEHAWGGYIAAVSGFDVFGSTIVATLAFYFAYRTHNVSLICLGIQVVSHLLSSLLLMLRFLGERRIWLRSEAAKPKSTDSLVYDGYESDTMEETQGVLKSQRRIFLGRESCLTQIMGFLQLCASVSLAWEGFKKIERWEKWYEDHQLMSQDGQFVQECLAWYGSASYLFQCVFRFIAAQKLQRDICWAAFSMSLVAQIWLFALGISASFQKEWSWRAEPFCAIVLAMATLIEGLRLIMYMTEDVDVKMGYDTRA